MGAATAWTRLWVSNALLGALLGLSVAICLVGLDSQGLGGLIAREPSAWPALALLGCGFAALSSALLTATAVMGLSEAPTCPPPAGGAPARIGAVYVKAR